MMLATQTVYGLNRHGMSNLPPNKGMARVTKLEMILTRIMGFPGLVEGITRVSVHTNLNQSNEVLKQKGYTPISTLLHKHHQGTYFSLQWSVHTLAPGSPQRAPELCIA